MNRRARPLACLLGLVLLGACSSAEPEGSVTGAGVAPSADATVAEDPEKSPKNDGEGKDNKGAGSTPAGEGDGEGAGAGGGEGAGGGAGGGSSASGQAGGGGGNALFPRAGRYVYEQSGYEEFCQASCEREPLPDEQPVEISIRERTSDSAIVDSEARTSNTRVARTTYRFTPDVVFITELYTRVDVGAFDYSDSYKPKPPIESLRFPPQVGARWSGSWKGDVAGDYSIAIVGREMVAGIEAVRIETAVTFHGDLEGSSDLTAWIDPERRTILKTDGFLEAESSFGRYETEFVTTLTSGPGY